MEEKNYTHTVPGQQEGKEINVESVVELPTELAARTLYQRSVGHLLDVNHWQDLTGHGLALFQLTDAEGNNIPGPAAEGNYFKIDVPGPGSIEGGGKDWARVEAIESFQSGIVESMGIRVRSAENPTTNNTYVAHFYSATSTSTFTVTREGNKVTAAVYDRNIQPNIHESGLFDTIRNAVVATVGIFGFSKGQWKSLTEAFVNK